MVAYEHPGRARNINVNATAALAAAAAEIHARLVFTSTDLVFDGTTAPYQETSPPMPTSIYGKTKVEAEEQLAKYANAAVVRLPLMVGLSAVDRPTTFRNQLQALQQQQPLKLFQDEFRSPIALNDAARACMAQRDWFPGCYRDSGSAIISIRLMCLNTRFRYWSWRASCRASDSLRYLMNGLHAVGMGLRTLVPAQ